VATKAFTVASAAPGIFIDGRGAVVPTPTASRGQEIAIYITSAGGVTPLVSTGGAPSLATAISNLPKPNQPAAVTVGGIAATIDFIGIPPGLVGVTQINLTIPTNVSLGAQAVVVQIGGVASAPASVTVTN